MALVTIVYSLLISVAMGSIYPGFCKNDPNLLLCNPQVHHFLIPFQFCGHVFSPRVEIASVLLCVIKVVFGYI